MPLFQATPEVLAAVTAGKRLYFSGPDESSQVMLCTDTQTRKLQKVETSNTMLLVPPNDVGGPAVAVRPEVVRFAAAGESNFLYESEVAVPRIDQVRGCVCGCVCVRVGMYTPTPDPTLPPIPPHPSSRRSWCNARTRVRTTTG